MFSNHTSKDLSAYCNGELSALESSRVAEHLIGCNQCRAEFEQITLGVKLAERLPQVSAPDSLWADLEALIESPADAIPRTRLGRSGFGLWRLRLAAVAALLIVAFGLAVIWVHSRESRAFWEVARLDGAPRIGAAIMNEKGRLGIGEWLETDGASRAKLHVGAIGQVEIDPNTRVRLLETKPTEHRLELERGRMSAHIWAPPRLFFVDTPSAVAADLGCAYTLEVDDKGWGLLHVTSGWVALELQHRESMVPAEAACATRPGIGPGTPYFEDASERFRVALSQVDFEKDKNVEQQISPLETLLAESRPRDTLTLWHLLARVEGIDRARVYDRLAALAPPPQGVTREGVLQLDEQMLQLWKDKLANTWSNQSGLRKTWNYLWTHALRHIRVTQGRR